MQKSTIELQNLSEAQMPHYCKTQVTGSAFTHLGLFEGIGGFSLAARWMGWQTLGYSEVNKFCLKILNHHFPNAKSLGDITKIDFKEYANKVDIITGGFPCQPFSVAGKRGGTNDERYLWNEMLRAIIEVQPTYIVGENVLGIVNWNEGMVFEQVQIDLEGQGYEVQAVVLPACGVNAPHKRERTWFVAYSNANRSKRASRQIQGTNEKEWLQEWQQMEQPCITSEFRIPSYTNTTGQQERWQERFKTRGFAQDYGLASEPGLCRGNDGFPNRVDRLKGLGNAIVPQVALQIFQSLEDVHLHCQ